jgi:VIT1/CCC1 family predicted Fe2+/Mn2+ transporter
MHGQPDRIERFKADIADLRITDPSAGRDRLATRLGMAAMAAGVILPIIAYFLSHGTSNALSQRDAIVLALLGVALAAIGGALYLKGALAGFLRFWLVRDLHERRAQTDRLLSALTGGEGDHAQKGEPS